MNDRSWHVPGDAMEAGLAASAEPFFTAMTQGTMRFLLFAPRDIDTQRPHTQDELYIVKSGSGCFVRGVDRVEFATGDALFVPAGRG